MDNWCIVKGAKNVDAAYNFINFILEPENSVKDLEFHGYNTGVKGVQGIVPTDTKYPEMIFFTDAQVATFEAGEVEHRAGAPGRHLQQGQGQGRRLIER